MVTEVDKKNFKLMLSIINIALTALAVLLAAGIVYPLCLKKYTKYIYPRGWNDLFYTRYGTIFLRVVCALMLYLLAPMVYDIWRSIIS